MYKKTHYFLSPEVVLTEQHYERLAFALSDRKYRTESTS